MTIRYRPMKPEDVGECAGVIARHPVVAARYGDMIRHLAPVWLRLLGSDGFSATVFEEVEHAHPRVLGAGVAVFVTDDFIHELKTESSFWIGPELTSRIARGESPVLTDKQVREANSFGGLNLAVWQTGVLPEDLVRDEVGVLIMAAFVEDFRGFLLKESVTQAETPEHVEALRLTGGLLWNRTESRYGGFSSVLPAEMIGKPHVIGISRDLATQNLGSWAASMFLYQAPRFGFNRSEQRLLLAALRAGTDQELSRELCISPETVKKAWRRIYNRVAACAPELFPRELVREEQSPERGREKRQRLLIYLRDRPEELRPASRKLLRQNGARSV